MRRARLLIAPGALLVLLVAAWLVDLRLHDARVARNVEVAGIAVGGMDKVDLRAALFGIATTAGEAPVRVDAPGGGFQAPGREMGVRIDALATANAALATGRQGAVPARIIGWALSPLRPRRAPVRIRVDRSAVYRAVAAHDPGPRTAPREPRIAGRGGQIRVVHGAPGRGIDPADVIDALPDAAGRGLPLVVEVTRGRVQPRHRFEEAEALAADAERLTVKPFTVGAGQTTAVVPVATFRSWLTSRESGGRLELAMDEDRALSGLRKLLPDAGRPAQETKFSVDGGRVVIIGGTSGRGCCAKAALEILERAIAVGRRQVYALPLTEVKPSFTVEEARQLGIVQAVATFHTAHPAGQPRVTNIHRIADLMRGKVIRPGQVLSINTAVGRRTAERGFVNAPVIEEGRFSEGVGGGVSQFATTLFNAAFEAGLEFPEYQSHSIYISRYPYGREATLNFPHPDLKIRNVTPYGILIWPTYTDTGITVTLYSTRFMASAQTGQARTPRGPCTLVRTERTRRFLTDGSVKVDHVSALYRPEEGVSCN
ncbi:MAG TPA: VanW family protein [Acidimicrobiales bacterium]|nr:VanW family protein [Acidimicrobiales bacterium]